MLHHVELQQPGVRESYGIELGIIQDMLEAGDITRAQAKALRRNVFVMSVDADSSI